MRTGCIERRDARDEPVAMGNCDADAKATLDRQLRAAGFILIDLPGGCTIEDA